MQVRHPSLSRLMLLAVVLFLPVRLSHNAVAQTAQPLQPEAVGDLTLEELMGIPVTSVAGVEQEWFRSPAALYVITGDEIRRSGHRSIAEALRLVPGVFVGRSTSSAWSIGTRGFNAGLANKTLVLIDGRAVYDPLFGGTFWNVQDTLLEDIDRIEVIRGPGPTLWGANAFNGIVNVITKSARQTQGWFLNGGVGTYERAFGAVRYGTRVNDDSWVRVWGKWFERDSLVDATGNSVHDDWEMWRGGFRFDHEGGDDITITLQGDAYYTDRVGQFTRAAAVPGQHLVFTPVIRDLRQNGGNMLFRVQQQQVDSGWSLQGYYDRTFREAAIDFEVTRDTYDLDWRHYFRLMENHQLMWGLGVNHTRDSSVPGTLIMLNPAARSLDTFSAFVQDTITLVPDRWFAMIGTKLQHNDYTGFEVQPSGRLWWTPTERHTLWGAISRPVRFPSRLEREGTIILQFVDPGLAAGGPPTGTIVPIGIVGTEVKSERLLAYELGHRMRVTDNLTLDTALFYNDYTRLIFVPQTIFGQWGNVGFGESYGGEITATWTPAENWRLVGGYSFVDVEMHGDIFPADERGTPHHMAQLRSYYDLTDDIELNSGLYYVDNVPGQNVPSYLRLDLGVTWRLTPNFEVAAWGQNLLRAKHREFSQFNYVERGFYLMGTVRF